MGRPAAAPQTRSSASTAGFPFSSALSAVTFRCRNITVYILAFIAKPDLGKVFDDRATKVMGEAFDGASRDLHDKGHPLVYEVIASRIIDAARSGQRDAAASKRV
jgi:hypothetical protein